MAEAVGATTVEWRQGRDKCIERRAGPGEDVDVEIIKGAYPTTRGEEIRRGMLVQLKKLLAMAGRKGNTGRDL